jgi:hypothetical protein
VTRPSRNRAAVEATVAALRTAGRVERVDAATLALARSTAGALDDVVARAVAGEGAATFGEVASVARVHLAALARLTGTGEVAPDGLDALLASLSGPLGDTPHA